MILTFHPQTEVLLQWFEMGATSNAIGGAFKLSRQNGADRIGRALSVARFEDLRLQAPQIYLRRRFSAPPAAIPRTISKPPRRHRPHLLNHNPHHPAASLG
jgi:hypothetical protein